MVASRHVLQMPTAQCDTADRGGSSGGLLVCLHSYQCSPHAHIIVRVPLPHSSRLPQAELLRILNPCSMCSNCC